MQARVEEGGDRLLVHRDVLRTSTGGAVDEVGRIYTYLLAAVGLAASAIGVTTLFGTLEPGPTLWSLRVLAHLGFNAGATMFAAVAVIQFLRARSPGPLGGEGPTRPPTRVSSG